MKVLAWWPYLLRYLFWPEALHSSNIHERWEKQPTYVLRVQRHRRVLGDSCQTAAYHCTWWICRSKVEKKKKKTKTTRHEQEKQWLAAQVQKYYEETQQQNRNTDKRHKGQQISGRPLQCFASKEEKTHYGYGSTKICPLQLSSRREHPITVRSPKDHHLPSTLSLICSCMDIRSGER